VTLYKVIVGSAAAVDFSTGAVLSLYDSTGPATGLQVSIQVSTNIVPDGNQTWNFRKVFVNGFTMQLSTGLNSGDENGAVTALFYRGIPPNFDVASSSFLVVDSSTHVLRAGRTLLRSIKVMKPDTGGNASIEVYDAATAAGISASANQKISMQLDTMREEFFDGEFPSGLVVNFENLGASDAEVYIEFEPLYPGDRQEYWSLYHSSAAETTENPFDGPGVFGGVFNGTSTPTGQITIYDSASGATGIVGTFDANTLLSEQVPVILENGLVYTTTGASPWTIRYRRVRPRTPVTCREP
jgi:hypothetical protein